MTKPLTTRQQKAQAKLRRAREQATRLAEPRIVCAETRTAQGTRRLHIAVAEYTAEGRVILTNCGKALSWPSPVNSNQYLDQTECRRCGAHEEFETIRARERQHEEAKERERQAELRRVEQQAERKAAQTRVALTALQGALAAQGFDARLHRDGEVLRLKVEGVALVVERER